MKFSKTLTTIGALLLGLSLTSGAVTHADINEDGKGGTTTATVGLETDTDTNPLKLTEAPDFDFGAANKLDGGDQTLYTTSTGILQVLNPGYVAGWQVQVSGSPFLNGSTELKGAELSLNGVVAPATGTADNENKPVFTNGKINESATTIFKAAAGNGIGTWNTSFTADKSASLYILGGNVPGSYKSTLNWTLINSADSAK
ncbi:WxL domain-containing protein [Lapidilactobacillus luobeiensis]|uniref:WxL domain-containing protein n=1 Tax=Lapidilactobacillus luobeiensis TaxID=2950371 RepID=UPI0021C25A7C|nr:WxL domain-containing protein [Lapidilactobacillus luobeiensis]